MDGIIDTMNMSLHKLWEMVKEREAWSAAAHGVTESDITARLNSGKAETEKGPWRNHHCLPCNERPGKIVNEIK